MTRLRRAGDVAAIDQNGTVYAALLPGGPIVVLRGIAALIWDEACAGDRETVAERVAAATYATPDAIRGEVEAFVADLVARGLLE